VNIPNYPDIADVHEAIRSLPHSYLIDAQSLARDTGSARAANMVMVGAASHLLPVSPEAIDSFIHENFMRKGGKILETNLRAFRAGREAMHCPA
jgi:indolepyruvate ferredoxin oxidoreductase beta subunit